MNRHTFIPSYVIHITHIIMATGKYSTEAPGAHRFDAGAGDGCMYTATGRILCGLPRGELADALQRRLISPLQSAHFAAAAPPLPRGFKMDGSGGGSGGSGDGVNRGYSGYGGYGGYGTGYGGGYSGYSGYGGYGGDVKDTAYGNNYGGGGGDINTIDINDDDHGVPSAAQPPAAVPGCTSCVYGSTGQVTCGLSPIEIRLGIVHTPLYMLANQPKVAHLEAANPPVRSDRHHFAPIGDFASCAITNAP